MTIGVYAGSFDPFTHGHAAVARAACQVFDEVVIAIGINVKKKGLFGIKERQAFIQEYVDTGFYPAQVDIESFKGLLMTFCKAKAKRTKEKVSIVRGLRAVSDFESEMGIADVNSKLYLGIPTIFLPAGGEVAWVSSSYARELALYPDTEDTLTKHYVIPTVAKAMRRKFAQR